MSFFEINKTYRDRGTNYKRFEDDRFTSKLVDSSGKTIPHQGGMRFKEFNNIKIQVPTKPGSYVKPYIVIISSSIDTENENPWADEISKDNTYIKYWGDAKGKKRFDSCVGNKVMAESYYLRKELRELTPPILHFSKDKIGFVRFNGLCVIDGVETTSFEYKEKRIKNFLFHLTVLNETKVSTNWLVERANCEDLDEINPKLAPKSWANFIANEEVYTFKKKNSSKKKELSFSNEKLTVILWICLHKGFSTFDDASYSNKYISKVLNVNGSSLDMYARHLKFHCFRLDLYGKTPRGGKRVADVVDLYRTDQRKLVKAAKDISQKNNWFKDLKEYL